MSQIGIFGGTKKTGADEVEPRKRFQTDPELLKEYGIRLDVTPDDAKFFIDTLVDAIQYLLNRDGVVNIRRLGLLHLQVRKRAKLYNPLNKQYYNVSIGYRVKFTPSGSLKSKVNNRVKDNLKKAGELGESLRKEAGL